MATTDLAIKIATTMDATGINKADKSVKGLDKSVKRLGQSLGLAFGTAALVRYSRNAVKAFAADEAAARRLATAVDNLGLSFYQADVETFISQTERSAAILDDKLRPAMQALLTTTGSLTQAQKLLNNAIQISRASGTDLAVVAQDLANGYVGITRGLKKYNTGLTQAELKSKSFNEILGIMLARSAGAADAYLTTTAYKMEVLSVATANAEETIGKGLVDALAKLGGGSTASDAATTIDNIAKGINAITNAAATAVGTVVKLYRGLDYLTSFGGITGSNGKLVQYDKKMREKEALRISIASGSMRSASPAGTAQRTAQQRQAEAAAAKRAKEIANLSKKQLASQKALTAEQKKQALLKKQAGVFDLEQIQLIAALQGNLSKEERTRLEAQLALLNGNEAVAASLTKQILMSQDATGQLYKLWQTLPDARNPFKYLEDYLEALAKKAALLLTGTAPVIGTNPNNGSWNGFNNNPSFPDTNVAPLPVSPPPAGGFGGSVMENYRLNQITVQIDGKAVASALQDSSMSGTASSVNRLTGGWSIS